MKRLFIMILVCVLSSCGTAGKLAQSDSSHIEVRTETVFRKDTAYVELPVIVEKVQTLDTVSVLENKYAKSEVSVSGCILSHSLETKPVKEPVTVIKQIVYRDSLVYVDRVLTETVEVEKKLSKWAQFKMKTGGIALIMIALAIIYFMFNFFNLTRP